MRPLRIVVAIALVLSIATSALAQSPAPVAAPAPTPSPTSGTPVIYTGAAVFAAGMSTALYGFIRAGNGEYSTFGEATSRNKQLGAAGLAAAFAGGAMMFLGSRARYAPSVTPRPGGFAVEKAVSW